MSATSKMSPRSRLSGFVEGSPTRRSTSHSRSGSRIQLSDGSSASSGNLYATTPSSSSSSSSSSYFRKMQASKSQSVAAAESGIVPTLITFVLDELQKPDCQYRDFTGETCLDVVADFLFVLSSQHSLRGKPIFPTLLVVMPDVKDRHAFLTALALANDA